MRAALGSAWLLLGCARVSGTPGLPASDAASQAGDAAGDGADAGASEDGPAVRMEVAPPGQVYDGPLIEGGGLGGGGDGAADGAGCARDLKAVVRDFRGYADASGSRHPDFEGTFSGQRGLVAAMLGADSKPMYAPAGATRATTGKAEFDQWYRDVPGVNMRFDDVLLPLTEDPARPQVYVFDDQDFFPIDGRGFPSSFGGNNFHFTTEIHLEFPYRGGESFTFRGDDDLFLFINGRLAIDLGGVHPAEMQTVNLDERAVELGIEKNRSYHMDIFHAERHTTFSTFRIETSLQCFTNVVVQ
jgi:fibro-slime domain-containing protein